MSKDVIIPSVDSQALSGTADTPFSIHFSAAGEPAPEHLLTRFAFDPEGIDADDPAQVLIPLKRLSETPLVEIWESPTPVNSGNEGTIAWNSNDEVLFMHLREAQSDDIASQTELAYARLSELQKRLGYPCSLRYWNVFADINEGEADAELYKQFCLGRGQALKVDDGVEKRLPAASALGGRQPELMVCVLASKQPGQQIENPRQVSAYKYPRQYGPRSPSFARATLKNWNNSEQDLFISGTASIVGHETLHIGNPLAQLDETLTNIESLLSNTSKTHGRYNLGDMDYLRVYIRHAEDYAPIREKLEARIGRDLPIIYLHADICRADLLVEIEGHFRHNQ